MSNHRKPNASDPLAALRLSPEGARTLVPEGLAEAEPAAEFDEVPPVVVSSMPVSFPRYIVAETKRISWGSGMCTFAKGQPVSVATHAAWDIEHMIELGVKLVEEA